MQDKRHKQMRVITFKPDGTPDKMEPVDNFKHVMITDRDRETNNRYAKRTRKWFILDELPKKENPVKKTGRPKKETQKSE